MLQRRPDLRRGALNLRSNPAKRLTAVQIAGIVKLTYLHL